MGAGHLDALTGEQLAVRAGAKGPDAKDCFSRLVRMYEERLFNFLFKRCRRRDQAEDLTQETFLRAWERLETYDSRWRFSTWLFTIAQRQAVSLYRKSGRTPAPLSPLHDPASSKSPDEPDARGAMLWRLAESNLTPDQHTALWLRYAEDMEIDEIARVMRKSSVGVRVCLFRARGALAALMNEQPEPAPVPRVRRPGDSRVLLQPRAEAAV